MIRQPKNRQRNGLAPLIALFWTGLVSGVVAAETPSATCRAEFLADTSDWNGCSCFYRLAGDVDSRQAVREQLTDLAREVPESGCPSFYLGSLDFTDGADPSRHFNDAARIYAERGHWKGVYYARMSLGRWFRGRGEFDAALEQMELGIAAADRLGDDALKDSTEFENLTLAFERGGDLALIEERLTALLERIAGGDQPRRESEVLDLLAQTRFRLGDLERARRSFDRLAQRHRDSGDRYAEATAHFNSALSQLQGFPSELDRTRALERLNTALRAAYDSGNLRVQTAALRQLGRLIPGPAGQERLRQAIDIARRLGEPQLLYSALLAYGEEIAVLSPNRATKYVDEALALVPEEGTASFLADGWLHRLRIDWAASAPDDALRSSYRVLDEIETLRSHQEAGRAEYFSLWLPAHQWLAGRLFGLAAGRTTEETLVSPLAEGEVAPVSFGGSGGRLVRARLDEALRVSERMRARILLETLNPEQNDPWATESVIDVERIQAELHPDEALLSWHLALWNNFYGRFEGGSWLLAIHKEGVGLYALADAAHFDPAIAHFYGLVEARDESEATDPAIAQALERQIIAPALNGLPDAVNRLILVPDGALNRLPFAALRDGTGAPLATRYALTIVPSATLWSHWRGQPEAPPTSRTSTAETASALVLADPDRAEFDDGRWPALPGARREARAIAEQLGRNAKVLVGAEATEAAVREPSSDEVVLLHFGAHALVDEGRGRPSGILLATSGKANGGVEDDGFLDLDEISSLDLAGEAVVLAACRSGGGRVLYGEGSLSLARAFLQSGAGAVVASLWPLRDDEAALFFESFYRHLARGESLSSALREVQRQSIADGLPAAAWSGVVLLGDGTTTPFPGGVTRWTLWKPAIIGLVIVGAWWLWAIRRSRRRRSDEAARQRRGRTDEA